MNRRNMIKAGIGSVTALLVGSKVEAKDVNRIEEERTRQYLDNLPEWDESLFSNEENWTKEYLFTFGYDDMGKDGYVLVYSPRYPVQKGHFFDLIYVKVGERNVTRIQALWKEDGHKGPNGGFLKLEDI